MAGEEWARRILEKELKRNVVVNDDGSTPGKIRTRDLRDHNPIRTAEIIVEGGRTRV